MINTVIELWFAGLWAMVWHLGIAVGLIVLCILGAVFSPIGKADFVFGAAIIALFLVAECIGINLEKKHVEAQQQVIVNDVNKAVNNAQKAKGWKDPWDQKTN